ncbi:hypothetical protein ACHAW5_004507 [Stephanodiscus triporus]|uniref:J domain-containing protein n=1 Tax=Stephanodiscus triporus TaxID=2934178 RepID=A0ABD3N5H4_9STRA
MPLLGAGPSSTSTAVAAADAGDVDVDAGTASNDGEGSPGLVTSIDVVLPMTTREGGRRRRAKEARVGEGGEDREEECAEWAAQGECEANPTYMLDACTASCSSGSGVHDDEEDEDNDDVGEAEEEEEEGEADATGRRTVAARVYEGEDAAIGAFRFAEEYSTEYPNGVVPTSAVLSVARRLQKSLAEGRADYAPPTTVTHCGGGGGKSRPCSAGKLWKRAEEFRKDDMHDSAGADLIRALLRSGIEIDFADRCERSLQWAIGSIRRQRERERRNAEEEAKLERRRAEEREALAEAEERRREYEADFVKFGSGLRELSLGGDGAASEATVGVDGSAEIDSQALVANVVRTFIATGPQGGQWNETLQLIKKVPPSDKTVDVLLIEARCHEMLGNHKQALSAAGRLISKAASYGPWLNDSPRMMAATLGANAAMQLGLPENAISFYQNVLKFDPEQERALKQYRGLKKVVKLLNKAEEQIQKGYNNAASGFVDDCLSAMRGLDVDSPLFRSKIQLKQCTILSGMGKQEEALNYCDKAVELRLENASLVSSTLRKEAHLVRAEALLLDMDYDDAVSDFRAAFDLVPDDAENMQEKRELKQKLQQAMHKQQLWNGGGKDHRYNEHTGYPDGRPPERDHAKILQLPIDLEQRTKDIKCAWLKKQFKALVRQYHPDKYKGNKKRAARKFKEVKEAKEIISSAWDC